ncbi:glycosyltransferase family 2 protein [Methylobacterium sp. PvR107]|uniref:glycosyltransferase family 2 protein n=1 Tax=Methylobacterium sp. PvR107 TaxID=2806597 RepID=UPI001AE65440|nr:glycosyltransferase [Methylobacterium sp. PvR107]MBP1178480.1 glycosyltransferase involved in cell wall biosynthesis [Methylobacterium sp. PvR107]
MAHTSPKVTIAIPVYNGADYLSDAIDSALRQTYENVEIIVLDDGSDDGGRTRDVALRYGGKIKYLHQRNLGVAGAMNHILDIMEGDFFTWLSHDDVHRREKVELQVEYYRALNKRSAIIFSDVFYINSQGYKIDDSRLNFVKYATHPKRALLDSAINGCTLFIPTHVMRAFGPFDASLKYVQDYALWSKILQKHDFFLLPTPLVSYRIHSNQGTRHPEAVVEGDSLWIDIACQRTAVERAQIAGSSQLYFDGLAKFLATTPYKHAAAHLKSLSSKVYADTLVSVVLVATKNVQECLMTAASILRQTHRTFELLLATPDALGDKTILRRWSQSDDRIKQIRFEENDNLNLLNRCLFYASGEYIAFADERSLYFEDKLQTQMLFMQQAGLAMATSGSAMIARRGSTTDLTDGADFVSETVHRPADARRLSTLMVHRNVICSGKMSRILSQACFEDDHFCIPEIPDLPSVDDCLIALME